MLQERILQLEVKLNDLKEQFRLEAIFSQQELDSRIKHAEDFHPRKKLFSYPYVRQAFDGVIEMLKHGWVYQPDIYTVIHHGSNSVSVHLIKPDDIYQAELIEVASKAESDYRSEIEENKQRLLPEIARIQVELKALQERQRKETAAKNKFEEELSKAEKELLAEFEEAIN